MEGLSNPFRGLLPFEEQHAALFFGRDKEIREVASRLAARGRSSVFKRQPDGKMRPDSFGLFQKPARPCDVLSSHGSRIARVSPLMNENIGPSLL